MSFKDLEYLFLYVPRIHIIMVVQALILKWKF